MAYFEIKIQSKDEDLELLHSFLYEFPIGGLSIEDPKDVLEIKKNAPIWIIVDDKLLGDINRPVITSVHIEKEEERYVEKIQEEVEKRKLGEITSIEEVDEEDWEEAWKAYFKPLEVGEKILICPTWEKPGDTDKIVLWIDPGMSFGSGTHESTQLVLRAMEKIDFKNKKVLDIGCGSGILSIASIYLGAISSLGTDIDPLCIRMTKENAIVNKMENKIDAIVKGNINNIPGQYDIGLINIMAEVIADMAPDFKKRFNPGAKIILSGIIQDREDMLKEILIEENIEIVDREQDGQWVCLVGQMMK